MACVSREAGTWALVVGAPPAPGLMPVCPPCAMQGRCLPSGASTAHSRPCKNCELPKGAAAPAPAPLEFDSLKLHLCRPASPLFLCRDLCYNSLLSGEPERSSRLPWGHLLAPGLGYGICDDTVPKPWPARLAVQALCPPSGASPAPSASSRRCESGTAPLSCMLQRHPACLSACLLASLLIHTLSVLALQVAVRQHPHR